MTLRCAVATAVAVSLLLPGPAVGAGRLAGIQVTVDRARITTQLGHTFEFRTTIRNKRSTAADGLVAHLNVLSLRPGTYVDPEDWASRRTRYLESIPAGGSRTITWTLEAVNHGSFGVYVAVLPGNGSLGTPTAAPAVSVAVADVRR